MTDFAPIGPPAMLGILGGGQLGRYFVMAARTMGYAVTVLEPDPDAPAGAVADIHLVNEYDDPHALARLAETCAVVTTEFENAPAAALATIADRVPVHPSPSALGICQDRIAEKDFLVDIGVPVVPYVVIHDEDDIAQSAGRLEYPAVLKTATLGYDGKGQRSCFVEEIVPGAWEEFGRVPCVLEQRVNLSRELSIVVARTADGRHACYPVAQNQHIKGVLDLSYVPARLPGNGQEQAADLACYIADHLGFVGVMTVEMFVVGNAVYVNELAPRPHNSGHYTLDACTTSQFEQQVRAICGLGLGDTAMRVPAAAMVNLLGDLWRDREPTWAPSLTEPNAHLHLYGKREARPGRKMGHLTVVGEATMTASNLARRLRGRATR